MFNTPRNECWHFALKSVIRLLPNKHIKNDDAML